MRKKVLPPDSPIARNQGTCAPNMPERKCRHPERIGGQLLLFVPLLRDGRHRVEGSLFFSLFGLKPARDTRRAPTSASGARASLPRRHLAKIARRREHSRAQQFPANAGANLLRPLCPGCLAQAQQSPRRFSSVDTLRRRGSPRRRSCATKPPKTGRQRHRFAPPDDRPSRALSTSGMASRPSSPVRLKRCAMLVIPRGLNAPATLPP